MGLIVSIQRKRSRLLLETRNVVAWASFCRKHKYRYDLSEQIGSYNAIIHSLNCSNAPTSHLQPREKTTFSEEAMLQCQYNDYRNIHNNINNNNEWPHHAEPLLLLCFGVDADNAGCAHRCRIRRDDRLPHSACCWHNHTIIIIISLSRHIIIIIIPH